MMDCTDRHFRFFIRLFSRHLRLYSEMISTGAILFGDRERFLEYHEDEHPIALQLGGSDPAAMAKCATIAEEWGYDEFNINVGCPSDRVQSGRFGACLLKEPALVANCVTAMREACDVPITVKTRIGVDDCDSFDHLASFVSTVSEAGCNEFHIHARKAWLSGLSPKENRTVPPLRYDVVHRLKRTFPELTIVLNGGITSLTEGWNAMSSEGGTPLDGIMIGRMAYTDPYQLVGVDELVTGEAAQRPSRFELLERFYPYVEAQRQRDVFLSHITRHLYGLFQSQPGARSWRRTLTERSRIPGAGVEVVKEAARLVRDCANS